jgi:putative spermidine/putrescine transport system ATP-binding protein
MERIETLRMEGVTRRFGNTAALVDFTLEIKGGTFTTLLGPSGCGKTTALGCLAGLLELSEGKILLNGYPIHQVPAEKRGFGLVFQNYALFPHLSAERNVSYGLEIKRVPKGERLRRVQRALEMVHLEQFGKRYPAQLSGGQQQRLAIARTIVMEPSLLLMDEPLSNLDANLRNEMRIEIKRIHTELNLTTVYVTHDQSEAMSLSDTVVVMREGRIEQVGTPQEIYNRPDSLYVARFMGYSNLLSGTLVGRDGAYWLVDTDEGLRLHGVASTEQSASWQPGMAVTLCFKSEETLADPLPPTNQMHGQAQLVEYVGKSFEVVARLAGEKGTQILVQSGHMPEIGEEITFGVRPERLLVFANDEQNGNSSGLDADTGAAGSPVKTGGISDGNNGGRPASEGFEATTIPAE